MKISVFIYWGGYFKKCFNPEVWQGKMTRTWVMRQVLNEFYIYSSKKTIQVFIIDPPPPLQFAIIVWWAILAVPPQRKSLCSFSTNFIKSTGGLSIWALKMNKDVDKEFISKFLPKSVKFLCFQMFSIFSILFNLL